MDFAKSPVAQDTLGRFYYTGDGEPRMSTYADAIASTSYPNAWFVLGVTPPITPMAITVVGGTAPAESRSYVYTFVTKYNEESGPSPAFVKTGAPDGSWNITAMDAAPPNSGTISNAVKDTPLPGQVQVTLDTVFGLSAYEEVTFASVAGMTDLNGTFALVSVDSATSKVVVALATTQTYSAAADTWTRRAPHNTSSMVKRIYRNVSTNTDYKFVAEIPVANTTYSDTIPSTTVSLNSSIPTLDTLPPPKNGYALVLLANGVLACLSGNQLCLSDQSKPYSWPAANRYQFPGIGIALIEEGNSVIILTDGFPYMSVATIPSSASPTKIPNGEILAPCLSKRGVVDIGNGGLYPSHDGLYLATTSGVSNVTAQLFTMREWTALMPSTFKAAYYDGQYIAEHARPDGNHEMLAWSIKEPDSTVVCNETADAMYSNPYDATMSIVKSNLIKQWDSDDSRRYMASWQSKNHQLGKPVNLSAAQVQAEYSQITPVDNTILNANIALMADVRNVDGEIATFEVGKVEVAASFILPVPDPINSGATFSLVRDGEIVFSKNIRSNKAFKLPSGKKSDLYGVIISATVPMHSVACAEGIQELSGEPL